MIAWIRYRSTIPGPQTADHDRWIFYHILGYDIVVVYPASKALWVNTVNISRKIFEHAVFSNFRMLLHKHHKVLRYRTHDTEDTLTYLAPIARYPRRGLDLDVINVLHS